MTTRYKWFRRKNYTWELTEDEVNKFLDLGKPVYVVMSKT